MTIVLQSCAGCARNRVEKPAEGETEVIEDTKNQIIEEPLSLDDDSTNSEEYDIVVNQDSIYKVIGIIDGDTYDMLVGRQALRIRVEGIDAPERGMPFSKTSKQFLAELIFDKEVSIKGTKKDGYNRLIATTYIGHEDVSALMLGAGMAWHFKKYSMNEEYSDIETEARKYKKGLWKDPKPYEPWLIRKLHKDGISTKHLFQNKIAN